MTDVIKVKVRLVKNADKANLVIENISEDDEGRYFCTAKNAMGLSEATADVTLMSKLIYPNVIYCDVVHV